MNFLKETSELTPQHLFQSPGDQLQRKGKIVLVTPEDDHFLIETRIEVVSQSFGA